LPVLTRRFLDVAQKQNKLVHVWTIDDEQTMYDLIDFGVQGLMTDKPSILKKALVNRGLF